MSNQGFTTFGNTAAYTALTQGWSTFGNLSLWNSPATGFNTFSNASAWITLQEGYNTFENTIAWTSKASGWNRFGNTSHLTLLYWGYDTFGNQNFTALIDWYPRMNDTVDPANFTFMVHIDDVNGTSMNVTWEYWDGGAWILFGSNLTNNTNGTYYKLPSPWFDLYGHTYYYRITLTGNQTTSKVIRFYTQDTPSLGGLSDHDFMLIMLLSLFTLFFATGYVKRKPSGGAFMLFSGFTLICFAAVSPFAIIVTAFIVPFGIFIMLIGVKKWLYPSPQHSAGKTKQ